MKSIFSTLIALSIVLAINACYYDNQEDLYNIVRVEGEVVACDTLVVSYSQHLVDIIDLQCNAACHNAVDRQGNIILETYSQVKPYVDNGKFLSSIKHTGSAKPMPPSSKLPACDISWIESWIAAGAPNN